MALWPRAAPRFLSNMQVHTLFFAAYRETVGCSRLSLTLPEGASAADLVGSLRARGAPFDRLPSAPAVAVNERYSPLETPLSDDDVVALIPPVAGG